MKALGRLTLLQCSFDGALPEIQEDELVHFPFFPVRSSSSESFADGFSGSFPRGNNEKTNPLLSRRTCREQLPPASGVIWQMLGQGYSCWQLARALGKAVLVTCTAQLQASWTLSLSALFKFPGVCQELCQAGRGQHRQTPGTWEPVACGARLTPRSPT